MLDSPLYQSICAHSPIATVILSPSADPVILDVNKAFLPPRRPGARADAEPAAVRDLSGFDVHFVKPLVPATLAALLRDLAQARPQPAA